LRLQNGLEVDNAGDGFFALFTEPCQAMACALGFQRALSRLDLNAQLLVRIALNVGEIVKMADDQSFSGTIKYVGLAIDRAARLLDLAQGNKILLTPEMYDAARHQSLPDWERSELEWLAHGPYLLKGQEEAIEIYEVGIPGLSPLTLPADTANARRSVLPGKEEMLGWRPAVGRVIPGREQYRLERELGRGGFGEIWLARHCDLDEPRAFKFCFKANCLRVLKREYDLLRLLRESLGARPDIARVYEVQLARNPYFLEMEYASGGDLETWSKRRGGLATLDLGSRLELMAQAAEAMAAAHSIGVLHKDLKPGNVLIEEPPGRTFQVRLTDFGIGQILSRELLAPNGMSITGFTQGATALSEPSSAGTRLYMAPELLVSQPSSIQSDVYAFGVMLYQVVTGDLRRPLAQGWERDIEDELLREDIALCVDGTPAQRIVDLGQMAKRVRGLERRHDQRRAERAARFQAERSRRRRGLTLILSLVVFSTFVVLLFAMHESRRARSEAALRLETQQALRAAQRQTDLAHERAREAEQARRQAQVEAETAKQVSDFIVGLFKSADPTQSLGNRITAREILDRGIVKIENELRSQPLIRAALMNTMGEVYQSLGLYPQALPLAKQALDLRRKLIDPANPELVRTLIQTAFVMRSNDRLEEAESLLAEAMAIELLHRLIAAR